MDNPGKNYTFLICQVEVVCRYLFFADRNLTDTLKHVAGNLAGKSGAGVEQHTLEPG